MADPATRPGIGELLTSGDARLTPSERRVARALLADYPAAGLDTVATLAELAGVSGPTVVRFVKSLGFDSFREFQDMLRGELGAREASALSQASRARGDERAVLTEGVAATLSALSPTELVQAVKLLASPRRRIVTMGGDYSQIAADHLLLQLAPVRPNVSALPNAGVLAAAAIADIRAGDVWCVFDVRRYQLRMQRIAEAAKAAGAEIILFTDRWLSPIAGSADVVLTAHVEAAGPTDTAVPLLAVVEVVCDGVERALGDASVERLSTVDPLRRRIDGPERY
ncbi:MurR/RpiR family transcriptional regulator [Gulosibacter macacae]|uniref:MurR/RpiR family transcriptional regulator n=1 Tax=Gulosibacter macacae TaxID=2488791 RepID=A0A3P3W0J0_9MICO|nr:MurR/RpiR family transcriptional regulator [Gulosibacter macacae]RRJ88294.1 MurR/RpiR family transcriptional regulator [Gulosibacter macacae]